MFWIKEKERFFSRRTAIIPKLQISATCIIATSHLHSVIEHNKGGKVASTSVLTKPGYSECFFFTSGLLITPLLPETPQYFTSTSMLSILSFWSWLLGFFWEVGLFIWVLFRLLVCLFCGVLFVCLQQEKNKKGSSSHAADTKFAFYHKSIQDFQRKGIRFLRN